MNPNRDRAVETRRRALVDQIDGLEQRIADARDEPHVRRRLEDVRAELANLTRPAGYACPCQRLMGRRYDVS